LKNLGTSNWKRVQIFYISALFLYLGLIFTFSNIFSLKNVSFTSDSWLNENIEADLIGTSIFLIDTQSVSDKYTEDPNIDYAIVNKQYPDALEIEIVEYEMLSLVVDYRAANPQYYKLYKNSELILVSSQEEVRNLGTSFNTISVLNGPLDKNVYGEFVNYFLLLKDADESVVTNFTIDGLSLIGTVNSIEVDFTRPENLGKKASAVYQRMQKPCPSMSYSIDIDDASSEVIVVCNT
tara:strand:- start:601 stop:1311 length:711 start_codon:yes stop_codon:yes gene_type:complete